MKPAQIPALPLTRVKAAITSLFIGTHTWGGDKLAPRWRPPSPECAVPMYTLRGVKPPTPPAPTQPLTKECTPGKKWNQHGSTAPNPQALAMSKTKASHSRETHLSQGSYSSPLSHTPVPDSDSIEHRSPSSHLALALASPITALLPTKAAAARTSQGKTQAVLTSDSGLPPKPLGTWRLHRDTPTQGHPFKTR